MKQYIIPIRSPKHSKIVQEFLFTQGYSWRDIDERVGYTYCNTLYILENEDHIKHSSSKGYKNVSSNMDFLVPTERSIEVDGETIEISSESFESLKTFFKGLK